MELEQITIDLKLPISMVSQIQKVVWNCLMLFAQDIYIYLSTQDYRCQDHLTKTLNFFLIL